jgi:hypothetical protein
MRSKSHAPPHHFRVRFTRARSRFQEDQRFNIDLAATENFTFRGHRVHSRRANGLHTEVGVFVSAAEWRFNANAAAGFEKNVRCGFFDSPRLRS